MIHGKVYDKLPIPEKIQYKMATKITGVPEWMQQKIERLELVVSILGNVGPAEIKAYPEHRISEVKRYINEAQEIHQELQRYNIVGIAGQNPAWVALDKLTLHEISDKLELIRTLWDGGGEITKEGEVVDVSKPLPTDDFSDEEEEGSFW